MNKNIGIRVLSGLLQLVAKKGKIDLIHILVDGSFSPYPARALAVTTTAANGDKRQEVQRLIDHSGFQKLGKRLHKRAMIILEADKGYDSGKIRQALLNRGIFAFIPRRNVGQPSSDRPAQKVVAEFFNIRSVRWKVERTFSWLKRKCRRLLMRWERLPSVWNAFATLALICFWKEILFR